MSSFCFSLPILLSDSISISFSFLLSVCLFVCLFVYALFRLPLGLFCDDDGQTESPPHPSEPSSMDPKWLDLAFFIIDGSFCSFSDDPSIMNRTAMMIHQFRNNHSKPLRNHQSIQSQKTLDILLCPPNSVGL
ncbi:hypothetical protein K457DRAFT_726653 [Linnemannia elongata AG-77]|uniref:Uncharacterized protein n=1 Tax=Linnemannia elongata AG-77 TaxID=1314771 RepID=A0A197JLP7_9FUNG|nr:hypothetical protein K457DRAFT_726653 [Linnemannia elongata AG-77]